MTQTALQTRTVHSLAKIFADEALNEPSWTRGTALIGEHFSFQVAYHSEELIRNIAVEVESGLRDRMTVRSVGLVPSELPQYADHDDNLLRTTPGLYPDPLFPLADGKIRTLPGQWRSLWLTVDLTGEDVPSGVHRIVVRFTDENGAVLASPAFELDVLPASLPEQRIIRTEWFYADCIATRYGVEAFSEAHWTLLEAYIAHYAEYGINMILTPIFSPPLEMLFGGDRPTVQLVGVETDGSGTYEFDFSRLARWVDLCQNKGVRYFEFSHLFTQWGAKHAPKIMAKVNGGEKRIFGWETDAAGEDYASFLAQFLPALEAFVRSQRLEGRVYFHISDEPNMADLESYRNASETLRRHVPDFPVIDALSDYTFYETGLLSHPVVSTEHIGTFIERETPNLWAYYCCCEYKDGLSNRFFNMPSARTRAIGAQLYKNDIQGFLHWGYNHWYSQKSLREIDPFRVTDADCGFPSGDAFLVYPGDHGPISSIRIEVLREAFQDVRALQLLESLAGREETVRLLEDGAGEPVTFNFNERNPIWPIEMRERINRAIIEQLRKQEVAHS